MNDESKPQILACGYRSIISSKTSLEFPAWLLQLPPRDVSQQNRNCWWRSKRDFLLLGRAAKRGGCKRPLPKAAMEKLSQRAPWRRPDHECSMLHENTLDNYHLSMKKSLSEMDQFLQEIKERSSSKGGGIDSALSAAWGVFCRPADTSGLMDPRDQDEPLHTNTEGTTSLQESSRLGQYFCTPENASLVVKHALEWVNKSSPTNDVLFLEPSCGHGDIAKALLHQLDQAQCKIPGAVTVVAYDVDPQAIESSKGWDTTGRVQWRIGDFLASAPSEAESQSFVVVLGGPPYTTGAGSGSSMRRDLPQQFWTHCIDGWNAEFVAFLLPERYESHPLAIPPDWNCETHSLRSSKFFLQGSIEVAQPSILQIFCRKHDDSSAANTQS